MPSDAPIDGGWRRLHPLTLLFAAASRLYSLRGLLLPALLAVLVSRRRSGGWEDVEGWFAIPAVMLFVYELFHYFTLGYRLDPREIVIRRGVIWKTERHIPYERVQNIELVQHWAHRLAGVAAVRLDTGTGSGAEGELAVLSLDAVQTLRDAVREGRRLAAPGEAAPAFAPADTVADQPRVLVALTPRELLLHGLLTGSGWVVIAAAAGALWQADLDGWAVNRFLPETKGLWGNLRDATPLLAIEIAAVALLVVLVFRVLSAIWSVVKHYEFSLTARGGELFQSYGLLTRVGRTIPRARIQKLTITAEPLMRLLGRAAIATDTAASVSAEEKTQQAVQGSHVLVPIVPAAQVPALVREVYPAGGAVDVPDLDALEWHGVDPRAFRRLVRVRIGLAAAIGLIASGGLGWWAIGVGVGLAAIFLLQAWIETRFTAFGWSGDTLVFRTGAWTRKTTLVRAGRMQVVTLDSSPLDRRWRMAGVKVDTAGAAGGGHHVHVRLLPADVASALYARLRHAAAP